MKEFLAVHKNQAGVVFETFVSKDELNNLSESGLLIHSRKLSHAEFMELANFNNDFNRSKKDKSIGSQVRISCTDIVGTLVKKGFVIGNFVYIVRTSEGDEYQVQQVEIVN